MKSLSRRTRHWRHAGSSVSNARRPANERTAVALDSLRGVAALTVAWHHTVGVFGTWEPEHTYLAVDLLFVLSGFVLARNYDPRFEAGMSAVQFMRARLIRLYPLYLLGLVLGAFAFVVAHYPRGLGPKAASAAFATGLLGLPAPTWGYGGEITPPPRPAGAGFPPVWGGNPILDPGW